MTTRSATRCWVISLFVVGFALPTSSWAVPYERFDKMGIEAQAEFVAVMVEVTKTVVRREGKSDQWIKIDTLFTKVEKGDEFALGIAEYQMNEAKGRVFDLERVKKDPKARRLDVEDAWFVTLKKNGIDLSKEAATALLNTMASFHPLTYREYSAKTIQQRMPIIEALATIAWPDFCFRRMVREKQKTIFNFDDEQIGDLHKVMDQQFPMASAGQDGFGAVNRRIEAAGTNAPEATRPMRELESYILDQVGAMASNRLDDLERQDAALRKQSEELDDRAVLMPDGRRVFPDRKGDLWYFVADKSYKLEGPDKVLAQKLFDCKEARHIANGAQALEACREQVGLGKSRSTRH